LLLEAAMKPFAVLVVDDPMVPIILYSAADVSTLTDMALESANTIFVSKDEGVHGLYGAICLALRIPVGKRTRNASS
jgi:hypothetical protein